MIKNLWPQSGRQKRKKATTESLLFLQLQADYLPVQIPHKGLPSSLSDAQVTDNEKYMVDNLIQRECLIKALLKKQGIIWPDSLADADYEPLVNATRDWAKLNWPALRAHIDENNIRKLWLEGARDGDCIGLSVVTDTAILLGQYIVANRASLHWAMDRDPSSKTDNMTSTNRWVLKGDWLPQPSTEIVVDIEHIVLSLFINPNDSSERLFNTWNKLIADCLNGAYEGAALVRK